MTGAQVDSEAVRKARIARMRIDLAAKFAGMDVSQLSDAQVIQTCAEIMLAEADALVEKESPQGKH